MARPNQHSAPPECACGQPATRRAIVSVYGGRPRRFVSGAAILICEQCFTAPKIKPHVSKALAGAFAQAVAKHTNLNAV